MNLATADLTNHDEVGDAVVVLHGEEGLSITLVQRPGILQLLLHKVQTNSILLWTQRQQASSHMTSSFVFLLLL